jgi:hypothetical protein
MKRILTLIAMVSFALSSQAQLPVSTSPQLKNAILEEFTGIHCVYCPDGHKIAAQITAANPNRAFAVNIHTGSFATPGVGEPDFRTADGNAIAAIPGMGITGYPQGAVSRKLYGTATAFAMSRSLWTAAVNAILNQSAYVNVAGQATLNASTNQLTVDIEAYYTASSPQSTNKLTVMLLQNNINGPQTGGATYNPTMVNPDGTYRHMHALRDVITTGATGEDIAPTTQGTLISRTINYTIPATYANVPTDLSNMEVLVFVAEGVSNIINVARVPITITGLTTTNNGAVVNVVTEDNICINSITPSFGLKNMGNAAITSANISYSVNGGTASSYTWTGNVGSLGTANITLPAISFTMQPINTLNISVTSVNGGVDDDPSDNTGTSNFNYTSSTSPTVNITLNLVQDRYGSEITWKFFNSSGVQIAAGGPYANLPANGTQLHTHNIVVPAMGCYRFVLYDSYGDGINSGYGAGSATILDGYGATVYYNNGVYASQAARYFDVTGNLNTGVEENAYVSNFNVFPSPVQSQASVEFNLVEANNVVVKVINSVGQVLISDKAGKLGAGNHRYQLDASALANGLYFVELEVGNSVIQRKISVNK